MAASVSVLSISAGSTLDVVPSAIVECSGVGVEATWVEERKAHVTNAAASRQTQDNTLPMLNGIFCVLLVRGTVDSGAIVARRECFWFVQLEPKVRNRMGLLSPDARRLKDAERSRSVSGAAKSGLRPAELRASRLSVPRLARWRPDYAGGPRRH